MGLLDDILGQLAGDEARGQRTEAPASRPQASAGGGLDMTKVIAALLPVVIGMLANRQAGRPAGPDQARAGGGLGDLLGQVLGGASRGSGGLGDLLEQFQRAGFGDQVRSWVSPGRNEPIPPDAVERVFGRSGLEEIARRAGVSEQDASRGLSQLVPELVDRMTPDGRVPEGGALLASVEALAKRLGV